MMNRNNINFNFGTRNFKHKVEDKIDKTNTCDNIEHGITKFNILPAEKFTRPKQQASLGEFD